MASLTLVRPVSEDDEAEEQLPAGGASLPLTVALLFPWQEAFSKFSLSTREVSPDSSMKTALFAAAGLGLAGLTFLLVR